MENDRDVTRRDFLKTAAAVAAASTLPSVGAPAILANASPNNVVNYGMIGTGTEGCTLLRFLATIPEGRCVATCDIYPPNLKKGVETIGSNPQTYEDYRKMLERKDLDAVMVVTPLNLHTHMVLDALSAGKHVFVEKTMYFKEDEEEQIRKAVEEHPKQTLQVGLQRRSSILYQVAIEMIRKGALGKVMFVRANWHRNSNWRRPVPDPKYERLLNWRMYKEYSGGLFAELASHQLDVANWAIGAEPVSVVATGGIDYWKDGREVCDNIQAIYEYPGGQKFLWSGVLYNEHFQFEEEIMGDQGTLIITLGKGMFYRERVAKVSNAGLKENWWAGATVAKAATQEGIPIFPERSATGETRFIDREFLYAKRWLASMGIYKYEEPHDPWWSEMSNFLATIREGKPIVAPLEIGVADAQGVIYGNRAVETGQKVFWPKKQGSEVKSQKAEEKIQGVGFQV
jgi:predicted dehydrogenase